MLASQQYLVCEMIQQTYVRVSYLSVSDSDFSLTTELDHSCCMF